MMKEKILRYTTVAAALFLSALLLISAYRPVVFASNVVTDQEIADVATDLINWKKRDVGSTAEGNLINTEFLKQVGTTPGDWYPIGLGRLNGVDGMVIIDAQVTAGDSGGFLGYLANINNNVIARYQRPGKLHKVKATEWHRISLAVLAVGGDPRRMGESGEIDLIADGSYNRVDSNGKGILGKQGINGLIWGLISLDSGRYAISGESFYTRDDIIRNILSKQLRDGGWALTGKKSDVDITAMAIQALAPYYNSEKQYSYPNKNIQPNGSDVVKKVRTAVEEAIAWLSSVQADDGDFSSWGMPNCESAVQTIVALCSLGIDIFQDERFITDSGKTAYDGIMKYRMADGGFIHSKVYDSDNPTSLPDQSNTMAGEQVLYGLTSILRMRQGMRKLYDMRPEQSEELKAQIASVEQSIGALGETPTKEQVQAVYNAYAEIDPLEREYVRNYVVLSQWLEHFSVPFLEEQFDYGQGNLEDSKLQYEFTDADKAKVNGLPEQLTTQWYTAVVQLLYKLNNSIEFDEQQAYRIRLEKAKNEIEAIQKEVDDIKSAIKEQLYRPKDENSTDDEPALQWLGLNRRGEVHELYDRYWALSEYDRGLLEESDVEALEKCKTQVDNLFTALIIGICCSVVAAGIAVLTVRHIRKRRKLKRARQMQESDE